MQINSITQDFLHLICKTVEEMHLCPFILLWTFLGKPSLLQFVNTKFVLNIDDRKVSNSLHLGTCLFPHSQILIPSGSVQETPEPANVIFKH